MVIPIYTHESRSGRYEGGERRTLKVEYIHTFEPVPDQTKTDPSRTFWAELSGGAEPSDYLDAPGGAELVETDPLGPGFKMLRLNGVTMTARRARGHALVGNLDLRLFSPEEIAAP